MVDVLAKPQDTATALWVAATWDDFLAASERSEMEKIRCYYDAGWMRIEPMAVGSGRGQDNTLVAQAVTLYGVLRRVRLKGFTNTSFRRTRMRETQPDMAFYVGDEIPQPLPPKTTESVNVDVYGAPTLVIEVASTSLNDDLGRKRLLYERLGVREYWIVDVLGGEVLAFAIADGGSREVRVSQVLPGLTMALLEEALGLSLSMDDTEMAGWLMERVGAQDQ